MYQKIFFGLCYYCNNFCHKALDCKAKLNTGYKKFERINKQILNLRGDENHFNLITKHAVE